MELVGPLLAVAAGHKWSRGRHIRVWVDNFGSVQIWKKGYSSSCGLATTVVKAIATIAAGTGCTVTIQKIRRCSNVAAKMADALSKAEFAKFWQLADENSWSLLQQPMTVPASLLLWIANPKIDDDLGSRILAEIGRDCPVLGVNC